MPIDLTPYLDPSHCAVIVFECQENVIGSGSRIPGLAASVQDRGVLANIAKLLADARTAGASIFYCIAATEGLGSAKTPLHDRMQHSPTAGGGDASDTSVVSEIAPREGDVVVSRSHGMTGYYYTGLDPCLRDLDIRTVIVTGVSLNIGVIGTTIRSREPRLPRDRPRRLRRRRPARIRRPSAALRHPQPRLRHHLRPHRRRLGNRLEPVQVAGPSAASSPRRTVSGTADRRRDRPHPRRPVRFASRSCRGALSDRPLSSAALDSVLKLAHFLTQITERSQDPGAFRGRRPQPNHGQGRLFGHIDRGSSPTQTSNIRKKERSRSHFETWQAPPRNPQITPSSFRDAISRVDMPRSSP